MGKKEKIQFIVTGILVVMLIVLVVQHLGSKRSSHPSRPRVSRRQSKKLLPGAMKTSGLFDRLQKETNDIDIERDPFVIPKFPQGEGAVAQLQLSGILWDEDSPQAIINERIMMKGDMIGGHQILDIQKDRVIVSDGLKDVELFVGSPEE